MIARSIIYHLTLRHVPAVCSLFIKGRLKFRPVQNLSVESTQILRRLFMHQLFMLNTETSMLYIFVSNNA